MGYEDYPETLQNIMTSFDEEIMELFRQMRYSVVTYDDWREAVQKIIAKYIPLAMAAGAKGTKFLPSQVDAIENNLGVQLGYFRNFSDVMNQMIITQTDWTAAAAMAGKVPHYLSESEDIPWKQYESRMRRYVESLVAPYWLGATGALPLPAVPGDGSTQCGQSCKCKWIIKPLDAKKGDFDCHWVMRPAEHCQTCIRRAKTWNPLKVRDWMLVLDDMVEIKEMSEDLFTKLRQAFDSAGYESASLKGGRGSGHHGHRGRPGEVGGSKPGKEWGSAGYEASRRTTRKLVDNAVANPQFKRWFGDSKVVDWRGRPLVVFHGTPTAGEYSNNRYVRAEQEGVEYPEFDVFNTEGSGITDSGWLGRGSYFTPDPEFAFEFGNKILPVFVRLEKPFIVYDDHSTGVENATRFILSLQDMDGLPEELVIPESIPNREWDAYDGEHIIDVYKPEWITWADGKEGWNITKTSPDRPDSGIIELNSFGNSLAFGTAREAVAAWYIKERNLSTGFLNHVISNTLGMRTFTELLKKNGYDGVIQYDVDSETGRKKRVPSEIVAYYPNQIKSVFSNEFDLDSPSILKQVLFTALKGGPGSGHHGHAGRPGKHGGSLPANVAMSRTTGREGAERSRTRKFLKIARDGREKIRRAYNRRDVEGIREALVEANSEMLYLIGIEKGLSDAMGSALRGDVYDVYQKLDGTYYSPINHPVREMLDELRKMESLRLSLTRDMFIKGLRVENPYAPEIFIRDITDNPTNHILQNLSIVPDEIVDPGMPNPFLQRLEDGKWVFPEDILVRDRGDNLEILHNKHAPQGGGWYDKNYDIIEFGWLGGTQAHIYSHEVGHWLSGRIPGLLDATRAMFDRRTENQLPDDFWGGYKVIPDGFFDPYMGRIVWNDDTGAPDWSTMSTGSEIASVFFESVSNGNIGDFANKDPESFDLVLEFVTGFNVLKERRLKGGPGSGHHGHRGRPGKHGGSLPGDRTAPGKKVYIGAGQYGPDPFAGAPDWVKDRTLEYFMFSTEAADLLRKGEMVPAQKITPKIFEQYDRLLEEYQKVLAGEKKMVYISRSIEEGDTIRREYLEYETTPEQYKWMLDNVNDFRDSRLKYVRERLGFPETPEEFFEMALGQDPTVDRPTGPLVGTPAGDSIRKFARETIKPSLFLEDGIARDELYYVTNMYEKELKAKYPEGSKEAENIFGWRMDIYSRLESTYQYEARHQVSLGNLDPKTELTRVDSQGGEWELLPDVLYHVTTNAAAVQSDRLRSRVEMPGGNEVGLGGGESETISFTEDRKIASGIERALHEAHMVVSGKLTFREMLEMAKNGGGGVGYNWTEDLMQYATYGHYQKTGDPDFDLFGKDADKMPIKFQELLDFEAGKTVPKAMYVSVFDSDKKPEYWDRDFYLDNLWDIWHLSYSGTRERAGGHYDPLFFGTNWRKLATLDPKEFKVIQVSPIPGARGYQMSAMGEWRVVGGDAVQIFDVLEDYWADYPEDAARVLGGGR